MNPIERSHHRRFSRLAAIAAGVVALCVPTAAYGATDLLPDIDTSLSAPYITGGSGRVYITFTAKLANVGAGPLTLGGHRASTAEPVMTADQLIMQSDGTVRTIPAISTFEYDSGYARWGFTHYLRYELRTTTDGSVVSTGPELGFCVVDWTRASYSIRYPGQPRSSVYRSCGGGRPSLLTVTEGISVGWANQHDSGRKGQLVQITPTSVPSGDYVLVHRGNAYSVLTESNYANNDSSWLVRITWIPGRSYPTLTRLKSCPDSAVCAL